MNYAELSKTEVQHLVNHHIDDLHGQDILEVLKCHWQELTAAELGKALKHWANYISGTDASVGHGFRDLVESAQGQAASN